jgi:hypothetical protein
MKTEEFDYNDEMRDARDVALAIVTVSLAAGSLVLGLVGLVVYFLV